MRWTFREVARALRVALPDGLAPLARLAGVSIDSRALRPGELFVAIHGPRHDGHTFVPAALQAGASAALVARSRLADLPGPLRSRLLPVEDPQQALTALARAVRDSWRCARPGRWLAGVTGSMGKTTTKEILAALLSARFRVLKSEANLNNEFGAPLTLLRLEDDHEAAVLELGMSRRGELARLAALTQPEVGLVTNVAPVHLEFFASLDEIAAAKRELIEGLTRPAAVAVLNADDPRVTRFAEGFGGRVVFFGLGPQAEFRAERIEDRGAFGTAFDFVSPAGPTRLSLPLIGLHNLRNALAALAAASVWDVGADEARRVFPALRPGALRGEVLQFEPGFALISDCYNSSPEALASAIATLAATPGFRRRILVAGEMLELGDTAAQLHEQAGRRALDAHIDFVFGVRGLAEHIVKGARDAGLPADRSRFFETTDAAAEFLPGFAHPGDLFLIKGSRGVAMERIIEAFKAHHALAPADRALSSEDRAPVERR